MWESLPKKRNLTKLEEGDAEKLCLIVEMETPESCVVLHEVYEKYKQNPWGYQPIKIKNSCGKEYEQ